jgi:hypothetical protein
MLPTRLLDARPAGQPAFGCRHPARRRLSISRSQHISDSRHLGAPPSVFEGGGLDIPSRKSQRRSRALNATPQPRSSPRSRGLYSAPSKSNRPPPATVSWQLHVRAQHRCAPGPHNVIRTSAFSPLSTFNRRLSTSSVITSLLLYFAFPNIDFPHHSPLPSPHQK